VEGVRISVRSVNADSQAIPFEREKLFAGTPSDPMEIFPA